MTYEEFLAWCDEDTWAEWVDGEVVMISPASRRHQQIVDFLTRVLGIFVEARNSGLVISAPFQMKTGPELPGREPDLFFLAKEHVDRLRETYVEGPADLVIEVISPESRVRDRGEKFYEYEAGGVTEYWLIDPERQQAEFYQRDPNGHYHPVLPDTEGKYQAQVLPGFWLQVAWLWQEPLPQALAVLRELAVI
jgi:Uma2 family endonuclease